MSDDQPTPKDEGVKGEGTPPKAGDAEREAKIAAAKAKAAAKKEGTAEGAVESAAKPPWEDKPVPPTHQDASDDADVASLAAALPGTVLAADRFVGEVTITVPAGRIVEICQHLKRAGFAFLVDLTAVDWPGREPGRFDIVYWLHRFSDSKRLRLLAHLGADQPIASVTAVWKAANWLEREVYDMFGISFEGHPSLERILTWEGFNGHPLRKDFPVEGIDTGAAIYPDVYPPGHGPVAEEGGEK